MQHSLATTDICRYCQRQHLYMACILLVSCYRLFAGSCMARPTHPSRKLESDPLLPRSRRILPFVNGGVSTDAHERSRVYIELKCVRASGRCALPRSWHHCVLRRCRGETSDRQHQYATVFGPAYFVLIGISRSRFQMNRVHDARVSCFEAMALNSQVCCHGSSPRSE